VFGTIFTPEGLYYAMGMPHAYLAEYGIPQFVPLDSDADSDSDGFLDGDDNCPNEPNPLQQNVDNDSTGDACDADTIYGNVTGDVQAGVTVNIYRVNCGGEINAGSPVTNSEGYYSIGDLENGRYLVVSEDEGYSFAPIGRWIDIPQTPPQPYDFTATTDPAP
jgi:hypothetical protein